MPEIEQRLEKRYASKGATAQESQKRAKAEIKDRSSGTELNAGFGKGGSPKGSSSRNTGRSRAMAVKSRSDKEKKQSAASKSSHRKSPGQKRIRGNATKTQS